MSSCPDCPHLDGDGQRANGITPRDACCIDNLPGHRALAERMAQDTLDNRFALNRRAKRAAMKKGYP